MCDCSLKLSVKERITTTADFLPQNPQSEPGQDSPSPSFIFFGSDVVSYSVYAQKSYSITRRRIEAGGQARLPEQIEISSQSPLQVSC